MGSIEQIDQYKNNKYMAGKCEERAKVYEDTHHKLNAIYLKLIEDNGLSIEIGRLQEIAQDYLMLANSEWLTKRQYDKGEL
jgi:hypothetical protein